MENEFLVFTTTDLQLANAIRHDLNNSFDRIWVCILKNKDANRIYAYNTWGGRLGENTEKSILGFVEKYKDGVNIKKLPGSKKGSNTTSILSDISTESTIQSIKELLEEEIPEDE